MNQSAATPNYIEVFRRDRTYHELRLLLIIVAISDSHPEGGIVDGMAMLPRLDFLVRHPILACRMLDDISMDNPLLHADAPDARGIEALMVRHRYGPWDDRYVPVVGALISRQLIIRITSGDGRTKLIATESGRSVATAAAATSQWREIADRCRLIARHLGRFNTGQFIDLIMDRLPATP